MTTKGSKDKYERKAQANAKKFKAFLTKQLVAPQGFTGKWEASWYPKVEDQFTLTNAEQTIRLVLRFTDNQWITISGDTEFYVDGGWITYSRRGIDDSFYWTKGGEQTLAACLAEQIERARKGIARSADMVSLPLVDARVSKDTVASYKTRLAKGQTIQLTPAGMGTGYQVSRRRISSWARRSAALETFFGVTPLYAEPFDYD